MKAKFLALAALVLGMVSCQNDFDGANVGNKGEVDLTLSVAVPEMETRAAGNTSDEGGLTNIDLENDYDIRYILEVYDANGKLAKERMYSFEDTAANTTFNLRLVPGRGYSFVVWADFVPQVNGERDAAEPYDYHYNTSAGLTKVMVVEDHWTAIDESRDAYTGKHFEADFRSSSSILVTLTRPFAKLRVVTTDIKELYGDLMPETVKVNYLNTYFYNEFNALTQDVEGQPEATDVKVVNLNTMTYKNENPKGTGVMTLFADYFFRATDDRVMFTMDVVDNNDQTIPTIVFNTNIPVKRNYLTTVMGPVLTDANSISVTIEEGFANGTEWNPEDDKYDVEAWDGKTLAAPVDSNNDGIYEISTGAQFAYFAAGVNGTLPATAATRAEKVNWAKTNMILTENIDLGGEPWTPIGTTTAYSGVFDGNGKTVANLVVSTGSGDAVGLFGEIYKGTIKDLNVINATINGHNKVGVILGCNTCGKVENCDVDGATVIATTLDDNGGNLVGAIVGYLTADSGAASVVGCSVKNATITAFRDVAAVVGTATGNSKPTVKECHAEDVTVIADQLPVYEEGDKDGNAGVIVGRQASVTVIDGCTSTNVVVIRKVDSTKEFENALKDRRNEDVIYVGEGDVVLPASLAVNGVNKLTIEGLDTNAAVKFNSKASGADGGLNCYADNTELIFKNIKVVSPNTGSAYTGGFGRAKSVLFDNCYYEGQYRSLSYVKFNKCTIDPKTSYIYTDYSDADFVECTFNCSEGKGIQVYNDGNTTDTTINVTDCTFTAAKQGQTWDKKPVTAIDINSNGEKFTVNINNTTATGFPEGEYTGETLFNIKGGAENVTVKIDGNTWLGKGIITDDEGNLVVNSILSLETALKSAGAAGAGDTTIVFAENSTLDMTNVEWTPINVDGYHGADVVTIDGKGSVIKGLTSALFAGGFAGGSGIIIKNLTIEDSAIVADNTQGYGAFVNNADSMDVITLENCHLKNSSIITPNDGAAESRIGGLIGWTSGYNVTSDGPVDSFITVKNCSVIGCTFKGFGSIGAICGHAGANPATYTTIENCTIQNNNLISTDDGGWRVGVVVGTANVGEVTISNITESGNTLTQIGKTAPEGFKRNYYGRFVPGETGKLTIDGYKVIAEGQFEDAEGNAVVGNDAAFQAAMSNAQAGDTIVIAANTTIDFTKVSIKEGIIIEGGENAAISLLNSNSYITTKTNATFKNIKFLIKGDGEYYSRGIENGGYSHTYINCEFTGIATNFGKNTYIECTFTNDVKGKYAAWVYSGTATYTKCTFNAVDRAAKVYTEANGTATVVYTDCKFNAQEVNKSAVEIDASLANVNYNVTITNATISNMDDADTWGNKYFNIEGTGAVVTHDGTIWDAKNK